jgi:hypothetical protein
MELEASLVRADDLGSGAARAVIFNLGPEGAFVKSAAKLDQGAKVRLSFKIASHPIGFAIDAEVRWVKPDGGGAGMQFHGVGAYDRSVLDDWCQRQIEETRGGDTSGTD